MSLYSSVYPRYKLIEDLVHYILSGCNVHNGLHGDDELFDQILMLLEAITHQEAGLHGVEFVAGLDLSYGQRHRRAMMDAMKGDLLDAGQNIKEVGIDEGALGIDRHRGRIRC